jgi:hypothetical protein
MTGPRAQGRYGYNPTCEERLGRAKNRLRAGREIIARSCLVSWGVALEARQPAVTDDILPPVLPVQPPAQEDHRRLCRRADQFQRRIS